MFLEAAYFLVECLANIIKFFLKILLNLLW